MRSARWTVAVGYGVLTLVVMARAHAEEDSPDAPSCGLDGEAAAVEPGADPRGDRSTETPPSWSVGHDWSTGAWLRSPSESSIFRFGGRILTDVAASSSTPDLEQSVGRLEDPFELRRARIFAAGSLARRLEFKTQFDFSGGEIDVKDVYIGLRKLPLVGDLRIGHQKEPFGLEAAMSSNHIAFMERPLAPFYPGRNVGISIRRDRESQRFTWAVGVYKDQSQFNVDGTGYSATARLAALPLYDDDGHRLLHLGLSYSVRSRSEELGFRFRPEAHLLPTFASLARRPAGKIRVFDIELASVRGPLAVQTELAGASMDHARGAASKIYGIYVHASYFLTGEKRPYDRGSGNFAKVTPRSPVLRKGGGWGAWEVAGRYSYVDFADLTTDRRRGASLTAGLNWYLSDYSRLMFNYVRSSLRRLGHRHTFQLRFQFVF